MAITARVEEQVKDLVNIHNKLILCERRLQLNHHTYFKRAFSSHVSGSDNLVVLPSHVREASDFTELLTPLLSYIQEPRDQRKKEDEISMINLCASTPSTA